MGKFEGKKLLELGTNVASVDIVKYAKSEGAYVIVADYLPIEKSEAKKIADEAVLISTIDIPALLEFVKGRKIDGVFCGVSEINLLSAKKIADYLGLPCYFDYNHFRYNKDKEYFKSEIARYGLDVPCKYTIDEAKFNKQYPIVVKPNDQGAGIGVSICQNEEELMKNYKNALNVSDSHSAFVEEFIEGDEVSIVYTIYNGKVSLSCMKDKLMSHDHLFIASQSDMLFCPSKYLDYYIENINQKVIKFIQDNFYKNGTVFLQAICKNKKFYFIEMGCRMSGGADYKLIESNNDINLMKMMVDYALTGKVEGYDLSLDDPHFKKYTVKYNLYAHGGVISEMSGIEEIINDKNIEFAHFKKYVGDTIEEDGSLRQQVFSAYISSKTIEEIISTIQKIQSKIVVKDIDSKNMLYKNFDVLRLTNL